MAKLLVIAKDDKLGTVAITKGDIVVPLELANGKVTFRVLAPPDGETAIVKATFRCAPSSLASHCVVNPCHTYELLGLEYDQKAYNAIAGPPLAPRVHSLLDALNLKRAHPKHPVASLNNANVFNTTAAPDRIAVATWNVHHLGRIVELTDKLRPKLRRALDIKHLLNTAVDPELASEDYKRWLEDDADYWRELLDHTPGSIGPKEALTEDKQRKLLQEWADLHSECVDLEPLLSEHNRLLYDSHKLNVAQACINLLAWNPWLDALVMQEVRSGINLIATALAGWNKEHGDDSFVLHKGPLMGASGGTSQEEYYPVLYRTKRVESCAYWGAVTAGGDVLADQKIPWDKKDKNDPTYRPVIVYELRLKQRPDRFRVGVVHTTPGKADIAATKREKKSSNDELQREDQYLQVKALFEKIAARDKDYVEKGVHWVIGGDYYISSEAMVRDPSLSLGKGEYESIAEHGSFKDDEGQELEELVDDALTVRKLNASTIPLALDLLKHDRQLPGAHGRAKELQDRVTSGKDDWIEGGENYRRVLRMLKLKTLAGRTRSKMTYSGKAPFVTNAGATVVRHEVGLSFIKRLPTGLAIMEPISGTNWDYNTSRKGGQAIQQKAESGSMLPLEQGIPGTPRARTTLYTTARIADIFVVSQTFCLHDYEGRDVSLTGLLFPGGGLLLADTLDLACTRYWHRLSDHFPVTCFLALEQSAKSAIRSEVIVPTQFAKDEDCALAYAREDLLVWRLWKLLQGEKVCGDLSEAEELAQLIRKERIDEYVQRRVEDYGEDDKVGSQSSLAEKERPKWTLCAKISVSERMLSAAVRQVSEGLQEVLNQAAEEADVRLGRRKRRVTTEQSAQSRSLAKLDNKELERLICMLECALDETLREEDFGPTWKEELPEML
jgi:hypothetical protein